MTDQDRSRSRAEAEPVLDRALDLVRFLRAGCPWDAAQTPVSLTPYLLEESLELADAILDGAEDAKLRSELGDLLLNVAFQIVVAEERGGFTARDVIETLEEKMRRRHPHLYGDAEERPHWEAEKANERDSTDVWPAGSTRYREPNAFRTEPPESASIGITPKTRSRRSTRKWTKWPHTSSPETRAPWNKSWAIYSSPSSTSHAYRASTRLRRSALPIGNSSADSRV